MATSLNNLAELYRAQGDWDRALPLHERSLAIWEKVRDPEHLDVATGLNNLAELYRVQGDWDRAELLRRILKDLDGKVMLIQDRGIEILHQQWVDACALAGRDIQIDSVRGIVTDITAEGALILDTAEGERVVHSGDITYMDGD